MKKTKNLSARIGVVGCGYWGPNLIRVFQDLAQSQVVSVCDLREERLKPLAKKYPGIRLTKHYREILEDPTLDAVVIATPISTHFSMASQALKAGKHVLVEKPLTATTQEGLELIRLSRKHRKVLMVGHTFEFNPAVIRAGELFRSGELGRIYYIDSVRVNLGLYQSDGRNVIWDLAPHDISIILYWTKTPPLQVGAWGRSFVRDGVEDVAFMRLKFPGGMLAHLHVSWLAPTKTRRITAVGDKKMIIYDDLENVEKIKVADRGAHLDPTSPEIRVGYRMGDIVSPHVEVVEPLTREGLHFIDCILHGKKPKTDGESGLQVVRVLEAADKSIKKGGVMVSL